MRAAIRASRWLEELTLGHDPAVGQLTEQPTPQRFQGTVANVARMQREPDDWRMDEARQPSLVPQRRYAATPATSRAHDEARGCDASVAVERQHIVARCAVVHAVYAAKPVLVGHYQQSYGAYAQIVEERQRVTAVVESCRGYVVKRDTQAGRIRGHHQSTTPAT